MKEAMELRRREVAENLEDEQELVRAANPHPRVSLREP